MRKAPLLALLFFFGHLPAEAFDYESYTPTTLDEILDHPPAISEGMDIFFKKRDLAATVTEVPGPGTAVIVGRVLRIRGVISQTQEAPAVNHCVTVKSDMGKSVRMFLQDVLVETFRVEAPVGTRVRLWVAYLYYGAASREHGFLVNEFEALVGKDVEKSKPGT